MSGRNPRLRLDLHRPPPYRAPPARSLTRGHGPHFDARSATGPQNALAPLEDASAPSPNRLGWRRAQRRSENEGLLPVLLKPLDVTLITSKMLVWARSMKGRPLPRIHYNHEMDSRERQRPQWTLHGNSRPTATPTPASSARSRSACRAPAGSAASCTPSATSAPRCPPSAIGRWRPRRCRRPSASRTPPPRGRRTALCFVK